MTQKEKARAYDEAIERAKKWYNEEEPDSYTCIVESIFPELKESEDERIRKAMLKMVQETPNNLVWADYGLRKKEAIAWLEKQDKKMSDQRYGILNKLIEADSIYQMVMNEEAKNKAIEALSKLEVSKLFGKLVDKTKPKFNVGDWIVHNERKNIVKVVNHTPFDYKVVSLLGYHHTITNDAIESNYHLWTIQDAKDGDVLFHSDSASNGIFLFKEIRHDGKVLCYCDYDSEDHFCLGEHHTCCWVNAKILHPATKKQRDTLMKAMADAGYTFEFEKKELKKIEQKLADNVEPKFKVGDKIQYLKGCGTIMTIEKIENGEYIFANNLGHTTIEDGNKWYLVECNTTWSKDDEYYYGIIQYIINNECVGKTDKENAIKWFKSLKERVQLKPKQEWSKEDEDILNTIINHFEIDLECTENDDIIKWLKSLRPQNKWKPSDKQIHAFEQVYDWYNNNFAPSETLTSLYNDLKKLKE